MSKQRRISVEEQQFGYWLEDAKQHGLVDCYKEQPETFELVPKAEVDTGRKKLKFLLHPHRYTPDFKVEFTSKGMSLLEHAFSPANHTPQWNQFGILWVDTKGGFTVQHGQEQMFQANRKLLWHYRKIWIAKVVPWISPVDRKGNMKLKPKPCLFMDTFAPECLRYRINLVPSNMGRCCMTVKQFILSQQTLLS